MNAHTQNTELAANPEFSGTAVTIIYEDRVAGLRAKHFSDMLLASLGGEVVGTPACWRSELIELPEIAEQMTRDASTSEFVILSLRGDTSLSMATKRWIEGWLKVAAGGPASLVALFDPERSAVFQAESLRCYLRCVTSAANVAFFSHLMFPPSEDANAFEKDEKPAVKLKQFRRSAKTLTSFFPTTVAA